MKRLTLILATFVATLLASPHSSYAISGRLCGVLSAAHSGNFSPEELCRAYGASFCSSAGMGEAICRSAGGSFCGNVSEAQAVCLADNGSFCSSVRSIPEAVCQSSNGSFCSSLNPDQRLRYYQMWTSCAGPGARELAQAAGTLRGLALGLTSFEGDASVETALLSSAKKNSTVFDDGLASFAKPALGATRVD